MEDTFAASLDGHHRGRVFAGLGENSRYLAPRGSGRANLRKKAEDCDTGGVVREGRELSPTLPIRHARPSMAVHAGDEEIGAGVGAVPRRPERMCEAGFSDEA